MELKNKCPKCCCEEYKEGSYEKFIDNNGNIHEQATCNDCGKDYEVVYYEFIKLIKL